MSNSTQNVSQRSSSAVDAQRGVPRGEAPQQPKIDVGAKAKELVEAFARTGDGEAVKALLQEYSGSKHSVGGAGSDGIDIPWSKANEILERAGVSSQARQLLKPTYERGLRTHFESRIQVARRYAGENDVTMMEHTLESAARHAKTAGVVTDAPAKIDTFKRSVAQGIVDHGLATAQAAIADPAVSYKLSGALGNITAYGVLAGMTVEQVETAKRPFMQQLVTQFGAEMAAFGGSVKRGYFQNHIKSHAKGLTEQAERTCANDPAMLKAAKAQIAEAARASSRATAIDYLKERDGIVTGQALIQSNIYARQGGLMGIFGVKGSAPGAEAFAAARATFLKENAANLPLSYACWKIVNTLNFVRMITFYS